MFSMQQEPVVRPEALAAAHWWGDQLRRATQSNKGGDSSAVGAEPTKAAPVADSELNSYDLTELRIAQFEANLVEAISAKLNMPRDHALQVRIRNDPDRMVYTAAQAAGIPSAMIFFYSMTLMVIRDGEVKVSACYSPKFINVPIG